MDRTADSPSSSAMRRFRIVVSDDRMRLSFTGYWPCEAAADMHGAVRRELARLGITELPAETLERLHAHAKAEGENISDFCLLEGQAPGKSIDGRIEWARDFFDTSFVTSDETGQIDYRKRRAQLSLNEGELIARVVPGTRGEDGADVFGKPVRARLPHTPKVVAGGGVKADKESLTYSAKVEGRFRWNGRRLDVDTVYTIEGDAGLATGDVDHKGAVIITGDVRSGATVRAKGDIEVMGMVEAADIETAGCLMVRRGIVGQPGKRIQAGRDVFARFIIEGHVTARGSVTAEREIINSEIISGGAVRVPAGRAFGGHIVAHGGVEVKALGSEGLVHTDVTAGVDPFLQAVLGPLEGEYAATRNRLKTLNGSLQPLLQQKDRLRHDQKRALAELLRTARALGDEIERLRVEIGHIREQSAAEARHRVAARDRVHPEVVVHMRGKSYRVTDGLIGSLVFAPHGDSIRLTAV